jgi:lipopolysaccharide exporter
MPPRDSFRAHVLTLTAGTAVAQGINALSAFVLARLFSPESFGVFALFMAVSLFLSAVSSLRYEVAIVLPESDEEAVNVGALCFLVLGAVCAASLAFVTFLQQPIVRLLGEPSLARWLWSIPVSIFSLGSYQVFNYWSNRKKQFHRLALSRISQSVATILCQLALFWLHFDAAFALIFGWIAGQAVGAVVLGGMALREDGRLWARSLNIRLMREGFARYRNFPIYNAPFGFVGTASQQLSYVVLRVFGSLQVVGLFSLARRVVYLPLNLITFSMNQVFYQKAATETDARRLESFVLGALKFQIMLGTPALIFFLFEAKPLFALVLGPKWAPSAIYAGLLACSGFMAFISSWLNRLFDVHSKQKLALAWQVGHDVAVLGSLAITLWLSGNAILAVAVSVIFDFLGELVWLLMAFRVASFDLEGLWSIAKQFAGVVALAVLVFCPLYLIFSSWHALVASTIAMIVMSAALYMRTAGPPALA